MSWARGRAGVERLITDGELKRVRPSVEAATRLLADAGAHISLASKGIEEDPAGALQLCYDAARKAATALLAVQGLRATTRGGHIAVIDAVHVQSNDEGGMAVFGRLHALRRRRNRAEYPDDESPGVNKDDARKALDTARAVLQAAERLLGSERLGTSASTRRTLTDHPDRPRGAGAFSGSENAGLSDEPKGSVTEVVLVGSLGPDEEESGDEEHPADSDDAALPACGEP